MVHRNLQKGKRQLLRVALCAFLEQHFEVLLQRAVSIEARSDLF